MYYGKNCQLARDRSIGKQVEFLAGGLKNSDVKCTTESFTAAEPIPKDSQIQIASFAQNIVPAFALVWVSKMLCGFIGSAKKPFLFGSFYADGGEQEMTMPAEINELIAQSGDIKITTTTDFEAGGRISVKLFYTIG